MKLRQVLLSAFLIVALGINATLTITSLRTEGMTNPLGIDAVNPRLSWKTEATTEKNVMQKAFHILVASSAEKLNSDEGDIWNSGKMSSDESIWIHFAGQQLESNKAYFWKVKVWTNKGETEWSSVAHWSMGLLNETDWKAQWIGLDKAMPWDDESYNSRLSVRYLRNEFRAKSEIKRATAHICGLGIYELYINGKRVGDQVLAPAPTGFNKTVFYNTYDVTSLLENGENAVGIMLGTGRFYTMRQKYKPWKVPTYGYPMARMTMILEYADGTTETVNTKDNWKLTADGPIRSNNEYNGEEYDARKELGDWDKAGYNDTKWENAQRVTAPKGQLKAQMMPGMRVLDSIQPVSIRTNYKKYILDMGQNMAGWLRIRVRGNKGDSIKLRFAEALQPNGELYTENLRSAKSTDVYILKGNKSGEEWAPRFVYHGFRYVEVSGLNYKPDVEDFTAEIVSDQMENLGTLTTSNEVLNKIIKNAWWGILGNYKGMPVDCPQRDERQPWLGDRTMGCWGESFMFDNNLMYAKWGRDITDAQREDGCIPDVAPEYLMYYTDNMTWPSTLPMLCDMTYTQFGNNKPIVENYQAIKKWMKRMQTEYMTPEYIVTKDKYGDWCVPPEDLKMIHSQDPKRKTDGELISTAYFYKVLNMLTRFANLQDFKDDAKEYEALAVHVKKAFHTKFFHTDSLYYGNNSSTSNLLPIAFGMVPKQYLDTVSKQVVKSLLGITDSQINPNLPAINTGVIGTQWLMRELSRMGRSDIAFALATNTKYPSWGYMTENGATTIWELWNGNTASPKMNSGNHVMLLGDLIPWCYENLGGIKSDAKQVAFKHIILKPNFEIADLETVDASYISPYGKIISKWKKNQVQMEWEVTIPTNSTAEVHLPDGKIENIGSGTYTFKANIPQIKGVVTNEFLYEKADFPQCHSATIVETTGGDLVSAFFGGTREGNPDVCIYTCRKNKNSKTWTAPVLVADGALSSEVRKACYNPVLYQMTNGPLYLFYKIGKNVADWVGYMKQSDDGGYTWSKAYQLPEGYLGPIKNKVIEIDGRAIAPSSTESGGWKVHLEILEFIGTRTHIVGPLDAEKAPMTQNMKATKADAASDIEGGDNSTQTHIQAIQPSILTHKKGKLQILCRTRNGKIATAWSTDKGETWTPLTLTTLPNNNSGTDAVTLKDGRQVLIYNAVATPAGQKKGARSPLNIAVSKDGIHWEMVMTLEDSPVSQYSYPSIIQSKDGRIHVVYTWRRQRIKYMELKL